MILRTRMLAAATLAMLTVLTGTAPASATAPGAVPVIVDSRATTEVSIAADGSYQVVMRQRIETRASTSYTFGGTVHDGFRLPDDGSAIPPYLRATFAAPEATVDGSAVRAEIAIDGHAVSIGVGDRFDKGTHRGTIRFDVTSAAVPIDGGYVVYIRPLKTGEMTISATDAITGIECVGIPPAATACGTETDDSWVIDADEFGVAGVVKVTLSGDPTGVATSTIDHG